MPDPQAVNRPTGAYRVSLEATLESLKAQIRPLICDVMELETRLKETRERGEVLARQAYGIFLAMGYTEEEARKELNTWRTSGEQR